VKSIRRVSVIVYALLVACAFWYRDLPRIFWTVIMPAIPAAIVLGGFYRWRSVCPIAAVGTLGARLGRARSAPRWLARRPELGSLIVLVVCLVGRHVAFNGDGVALALLLLSLPAAAIVVNAWLSGKAFCHYICPVGVVERVYTDGAPRLPGASSLCPSCTACRKSCPDIDQDRVHDAGGLGSVAFAFPGVVFGFYLYYCLRFGSFEAFFDGRWTDAPLTAELVFGRGFFFWPEVPALVAAALTLGACALVSYALFAGLERALKRRAKSASFSLAFALASFVAFNVFYCFAGAPALRTVPGASRLVAFIVPVVATAVLVHRFRRSEIAPARHRKVVRLPLAV
jgi:hypothetical protein